MRMSSRMSTMSAASTAMSLPIPPMAIPTVADFSAAASLTPSPTIEIAVLASTWLITSETLSSGSRFDSTMSMPAAAAILPAAAAWSPVSSSILPMPRSRSSAMIAAASSRSVSESAIHPAKRPSASMATTACPSIRAASIRRSSSAVIDTPRERIQLGVPSARRTPSTTAPTPLPGSILNAEATGASATAAAMALPSGCSERPSAPAARRSSARGSISGSAETTSATAGRPIVSVPVLSKAIVAMRPISSIASPVFTSTP